MFGPHELGSAPVRGFGHSFLFVVVAALAGLTCSLPTDTSDQVHVAIDAPSLVVIRGQQLPLFARAFRVSDGGIDTLDVSNVAFQWISGNPNLATVQDDGGGYAQVTGVNSGVVEIIARATAFERAEVGSLQVRVSNPLEVDSVRPAIVRFGDTVTVYGVGVDSILLAFLENATLFDYPLPGLLASRTRDSLGFSTATFWVTPPARTSQLSFIGPGVFGSAPDTTRVQPFDVLEPNQTGPRLIDLDAPPRFPQIPQMLFFNPALAFEAVGRDEAGIEWYRFGQSAPRDVTLILSGPEVRGTFLTFLSDSLEFDGTNYRVGPASWTLGPGSHFCSGQVFEPAQTLPESTIVALRGFAANRLHAIAFYAQPGRYGLAVLEGYVTSDPTVPRDPHEEDDFCTAASVQTPVGSVPNAAFRDTLTIDNPHDVDWIRFRVTSASTVTIRMTALAAAGADTSDVDLFLLTVPGSSSATLDLLNRSDAAGSNEQMVTALGAGDYYLVVVDYQGAPVAYDLCIDALGCAGFPSGPAATAPAATRVKAKPAPRLGPRPRP